MERNSVLLFEINWKQYSKCPEVCKFLVDKVAEFSQNPKTRHFGTT